MAKKNVLRKRGEGVYNPDFERLKAKAAMSDEDTTRLNVNVPSDLYVEFKQICRRQRLPMSAVIVRYIEKYIDEYVRR